MWGTVPYPADLEGVPMLSTYLFTGGALLIIVRAYRAQERRPMASWLRKTTSRFFALVRPIGQHYRHFTLKRVRTPPSQTEQPPSEDQAQDSSLVVSETDSALDAESYQMLDSVTWHLPATARLLCVNQESLVSVTQLAIGDIIIVDVGEMIPIVGVVIAGTAWIFSSQEPISLLHTQAGVTERSYKVAIGDRVNAGDIVVVGNLHLTVGLPGVSPASQQRD